MTTISTTSKTTERSQRTAAVALLAAALALPVLFSPPVGAAATPSDVVDAMAGQVLAVLRDHSVELEARRVKVEQIIYRYVDFETLSRLVMARNWRKLSEAEQTEFKKLFKKHLSDTYGDNVDNYRNEKVLIVSERVEKRGDVTVKSKVVRGGSDAILVDYRLRKKDDNWGIIDVIIEGVSLVANFRSQFQDIMSSGGADRLLKLLREKSLEPPPNG